MTDSPTRVVDIFFVQFADQAARGITFLGKFMADTLPGVGYRAVISSQSADEEGSKFYYNLTIFTPAQMFDAGQENDVQDFFLPLAKGLRTDLIVHYQLSSLEPVVVIVQLPPED